MAFGFIDPMEGYQGSPYPEIDNFVHSLVNKDGLQGGKETTLHLQMSLLQHYF